MTPCNEFGFQRSFRIDRGELDHLTPPQCFVLGYELAMIDGLLKGGGRICRPVHAKNYDRIEEFCRLAGRKFSLTWLPDDVSEQWHALYVEELTSEPA